MKRIVLDSSALIAYFEAEKSGEAVAEKLGQAAEGKLHLFLSLVNWGEVYYVTLRSYDKPHAEKVIDALQNMPVEVVPADREITKMAAKYKARGGMSYSDCFAAALAKKLTAELMTTDSDFKNMEKEIKVIWL